MNKKIETIMEQLTLEEKAALLSGVDSWHTKVIEEKGVPSLMMCDGPHGLRKQVDQTDMLGLNQSVPATCFPSAAAVCNSWDTELVHKIGEALGEECQAEEVGLLLGPGVNIKRSPLCGRNFEYFSEDPYLSGQMAKNHVEGVQSKGVGTSIKHFAVNNQETYRMSVNAVIDERTLREIYLASFEPAIREAKPWSVMGAYNKVNGEFCCENHHLLKDILRDEWGYKGVILSDWGAVNDQVKGIKEGFDLRMPYLSEQAIQKIVKAVEDGTLSIEMIDQAVCRILEMILKASQQHQKDASYDLETHHQLARTAAAESIVLLKNQDGCLPLRGDEKIAVVGAFANVMRYQGGGSSHIVPTKLARFHEALTSLKPEVTFTYAKGFLLKKEEKDECLTQEALANAAAADKVIVMLGLPDGWESEGYDREHMRLPANQIQLLNEIAALGKPVITVLFTGAPVETSWSDQTDALLAAYTGGQAISEALIDILYGDRSPCAKLAETWPVKKEDTPCSLTYPQTETAVYSEGVFVGYRYYDKKKMPVAYPFGFGLSYTTFAYSNLQLNKPEIEDNEELFVTVDIKNTGNVTAKEIVQLYITPPSGKIARPVKELKGFAKIELHPGETKTITYKLNKRSFAYFETNINDWYVESGTYEIGIAASACDIRLTKKVNVRSVSPITKEYTLYTTIAELLTDPIAMTVIETFMGDAFSAGQNKPQAAEITTDDEDEAPMDPMTEGMNMSMTMPLIKIVDMSGGAFPAEAASQMIAAINQKKKDLKA